MRLPTRIRQLPYDDLAGPPQRLVTRDGVTVALGDSLALCGQWPSPVVIVADGPYGVAGFPGDPADPRELPEWYEPHVRRWSERSTPLTTLWFWNTELGWANVHPVLERHGWKYRACHIWDKGIGHVAGNCNTQSLRKLPIVSEVCVQYVKEAAFLSPEGKSLSMQQWLRYEWQRSGLPLSLTNEVCGVRNAATRKYFTTCDLWYYPPVDAFDRLAAYANRHGNPTGRPYFSVDGSRPLTAQQWEVMRAKFHCEAGVTNVWREPAVRGSERLKDKMKCVHNNQKPLKLLELILRVSSDPGDMVWEPFGGLCSVAVACHKLGRLCNSAEINPLYFRVAANRLGNYDAAR